jgi:uncharacterized membrane protein
MRIMCLMATTSNKVIPLLFMMTIDCCFDVFDFFWCYWTCKVSTLQNQLFALISNHQLSEWQFTYYSINTIPLSLLESTNSTFIINMNVFSFLFTLGSLLVTTTAAVRFRERSFFTR